MAELKILDSAGKDAGTMTVSDAVFGIEPNIPVMHRTVLAILAGRRQGTHSTKTRGKVSGGGRKPFRQKGTGRARQGTIRAPHMRHGGVVFGPHPRKYTLKVNNKEKKLAMRSALSGKVRDDELFVIDKFDFEKPSTKAAKACILALGITGRVTVVVDENDTNSFLSFRNLEGVRIIGKRESNTYDLLDNAALIMTKSAVEYCEEVLA